MMTESYQPYIIDIVLSKDCNLSCIGCIQTKNKKESEIKYSKFINGIIEKANIEKYQIHFTGGEPFLKWDLLTKIITETQNFTIENPTYSIYTNLTILNSEIIDFIKSHNIEIHTSLDGFKNENDKIRGRGTYETVTTNIKKISKNNIELGSITTTLKNENINVISPQFINELEKLRIETWRLNIDYHGIAITPNELIGKVFALYTYATQKGISVEGTWFYPFNNLVSDNKKGFCPATKGETISILPDGKISMCPYSKTFLGTFQNDWYNIKKEFDVMKQNISENRKCITCIIKDYCQTQCLITREQNNTELFDWYCEVYRGLTTKLLNHHIQY